MYTDTMNKYTYIPKEAVFMVEVIPINNTTNR